MLGRIPSKAMTASLLTQQQWKIPNIRNSGFFSFLMVKKVFTVSTDEWGREDKFSFLNKAIRP